MTVYRERVPSQAGPSRHVTVFIFMSQRSENTVLLGIDFFTETS